MDLENVFAKSIPIVLTFLIAALRSMVTIYRPTVAQEMGGDHSINKSPF